MRLTGLFSLYINRYKICLLYKFKIRGVDRLDSYPESLKKRQRRLKSVLGMEISKKTGLKKLQKRQLSF